MSSSKSLELHYWPVLRELSSVQEGIALILNLCQKAQPTFFSFHTFSSFIQFVLVVSVSSADATEVLGWTFRGNLLTWSFPDRLLVTDETVLRVIRSDLLVISSGFMNQVQNSFVYEQVVSGCQKTQLAAI